MTKMNPEIRDKWVSALRSGEYEQGRSALKNSDGQFCCLGVLCDISGLGTFEQRAFEINGFTLNEEPNEFPATSYAPVQILNWAGLSYNDAFDLAFANDTGSTFEEIAERISTNL